MVRVKVSEWYKCYWVVFSHPLGDSLRVGTLWVARYMTKSKRVATHSLTYVVTVVINRDVAGKDARRIRHLTASQGSRASARVREQRSSF